MLDAYTIQPFRIHPNRVATMDRLQTLQKLDVDDISPQKPQESILPKEAFNVSAIKLDKAPEFSELIKPELLRISNADYIISSKMGLTVVYYKKTTVPSQVLRLEV